MREIMRLCLERGLGLPTRLRVDLADGKTIDVPFDLVRAPTTTASVAPTTAPRPVEREPADPDEAICLALFYANHRRTGPELIPDVQEKWPNRWSDGHISNRATAMAKPGGRLVNHKHDPNDGLGKGFGLVEWEAEATE